MPWFTFIYGFETKQLHWFSVFPILHFSLVLQLKRPFIATTVSLCSAAWQRFQHPGAHPSDQGDCAGNNLLRNKIVIYLKEIDQDFPYLPLVLGMLPDHLSCLLSSLQAFITPNMLQK